jgi:ParB family transcriptional regulator, chromosome partitioning protein
VSKRGLPSNIQMRHDAHYVEELSTQRPKPIGRMIPIEQLEPNAEQPRVEVGDLTELTASIKEKGVLEPLLVKSSMNGRWMIIAGERRWRAAKASGLREVPCIEMDVDERGVAEIALIENLQRKDLTAWEEADGLAALCEKFGYTHDDVARIIGKSRTTVTESLSIAAIPQSLREECRHADINTKSMLLQIIRQPDEQSMREMIRTIAVRGLNRNKVRGLRRNEQASKEERESAPSFVFRYTSTEKLFQLKLHFQSSVVSKLDVIDALKAVIQKCEEDNSLFS